MILDALFQMEDFRRAAGKRHAMATALLGVLLSLMSGGRSWRDHEAFVQRHRTALAQYLGLPKDRMPSYSTLRRVVLGLGFAALSEAFVQWAQRRVPIEPGEWLAIDGKSLRGTVSEAHQAQQDFTALVSLFCQKRGLVLQSAAYQNAQQSEVQVVHRLLEALEVPEGVLLTLDALHCRKKHVT